MNLKHITFRGELKDESYDTEANWYSMTDTQGENRVVESRSIIMGFLATLPNIMHTLSYPGFLEQFTSFSITYDASDDISILQQMQEGEKP